MVGALCIMAGGLVACGDDDEEPSADDTESTQTTAGDEGGDDAPTEIVDVDVAYTAPVAAFTPMMLLADDPDMCAEFGVRPAVQQVQPNIGRTALLTGEISIVLQGSGSFILSASEAPGDTVAIAATGPLPNALFASPDIESIEDLAGGTVGATTAGTTGDLVIRTKLAEAGLTIPDDVNIVFAGNSGALVTLAAAGEIDAFGLVPPLPAEAEEAGFHALEDISAQEAVRAILSSTFVANKGFADENPDAVVGFLECFLAAAERGRTDPEGTIEVIAETLQLDAETAQGAYDVNDEAWTLFDFTTEDAEFVVEALERAEQGGSVDAFDPDTAIDPTYLEDAQGAGS